MTPEQQIEKYIITEYQKNERTLADITRSIRLAYRVKFYEYDTKSFLIKNKIPLRDTRTSLAITRKSRLYSIYEALL